jgi:hypothetical protein
VGSLVAVEDRGRRQLLALQAANARFPRGDPALQCHYVHELEIRNEISRCRPPGSPLSRAVVRATKYRYANRCWMKTTEVSDIKLGKETLKGPARA